MNMEFKMKTVSWCCLFSVILLLTANAFAQQKRGAEPKLYRWVDENGEVHFSQSLPPDFKDKKHDVLDNEGMLEDTDLTLVPPPPPPKGEMGEKAESPRDASGMLRPEPKYTPEELRVEQNALLLMRYDSDA
jgi:hypothetical protein